jgi:alpha-ketoglutarate-dependent taurine dioxygenase
MNFTIIDNELVILREGEVEHIFERDSLSRATYSYMIHWVQDIKSPEDDPGTMWVEAAKAWDTLSPEMQATLMSIAHKESQQARDIRDGLLATLHEYQGVKRVKDTYAECIRVCFSQWAN